MILLIDNYDSFTYNLVHYLQELGEDVRVVRNDALTADEALALPDCEAIILSPGPCTPNEAGICLDIIKQNNGRIPLFGVCLGHQSIGQAFGANVIRAPEPVHGKVAKITHDGTGIFKGVPSPFLATRYHSLILEESSLPDCLTVTARNDEGLIMAISHKDYAYYGVQFHPESIASEHGHHLLQQFIILARTCQNSQPISKK